MGLVDSAYFVSASGTAAAFVLLFPVGVVRGGCSEVQSRLDSSQLVGNAVRHSLAPLLRESGGGSDLFGALNELAKQGEGTGLAADFVQARGLKGAAMRLAFSVALPRQDVILEYTIRQLQASASRGRGVQAGSKTGLQLDAAAGAANGVAVSYLVDWRDRATMVGGLLYGLALAGVLAADYVAGRAKRAVEQAKARVAGGVAAAAGTGEDLLAKAKDATARSAENFERTMDEAVGSAKHGLEELALKRDETLAKLKDAASLSRGDVNREKSESHEIFERGLKELARKREETASVLSAVFEKPEDPKPKEGPASKKD
eukprot:CAMPEP_0172631826 /NCGR_PEP_ID=MMETSP1068-20121228/181240_1 /TAXON_ID=35684 /ORGANISM="Pseudopedinella elastica, Strain CCMP716" /LENGTH=316 /DNA_ID=CAMNT_0013443073 /DNA_START=288 /DNA_END=1238 /DNA_ORIENTATION=+